MDATFATSQAPAVPKRIAFRDYLEAEQKAETRSEYLDGVVRAMAGARARHLLIESQLNTSMGNRLAGGGCVYFNGNVQIWIPVRGVYTYPDGAVACPPAFYAELPTGALANPQVIFEVLSPSTEGYDRRAKFHHYRTIETLEDYVLISTDEPVIEVFSRPEWKPQIYEGLEAAALIPSLGVELSLNELYALALTVPE